MNSNLSQSFSSWLIILNFVDTLHTFVDNPKIEKLPSEFEKKVFLSSLAAQPPISREI